MTGPSRGCTGRMSRTWLSAVPKLLVGQLGGVDLNLLVFVRLVCALGVL